MGREVWEVHHPASGLAANARPPGAPAVALSGYSGGTIRAPGSTDGPRFIFEMAAPIRRMVGATGIEPVTSRV
jgi:hypothetical protein